MFFKIGMLVFTSYGSRMDNIYSSDCKIPAKNSSVQSWSGRYTGNNNAVYARILLIRFCKKYLIKR
jgi:hypothetical protein